MTRQGSDALLERMMRLHPKVIDLTLDRVDRLLEATGHPELAGPAAGPHRLQQRRQTAHPLAPVVELATQGVGFDEPCLGHGDRFAVVVPQRSSGKSLAR